MHVFEKNTEGDPKNPYTRVEKYLEVLISLNFTI
jgi:hypothetical protein